MSIDPLYILALFAGSGTVIGVLFKLLISSKDALILSKEREYALALADKDKVNHDLDALKKSYASIAEDAVKTAIDTTNFYRRKYEDKPPLVITAPVLPESHSPSTEAQREAAAIATLRAAMAVVALNATTTKPDAH
jgi:hypothetical protein